MNDKSESAVERMNSTEQALFVAAVANSEAPLDALLIDQVFVNRWFREHPGEVEQWDGWEIVDEVRIGGRI